MWFVFVGIGLALLVGSGIYALRRIGEALRLFGATQRTVRVLRWVFGCMLFAYPISIIAAVALSIALERDEVMRLDGFLTSLLLGLPFIWAVLVVLQSLLWLVAVDVAHVVTRRRHPRRRAAAVLAVVSVFALYTPARILIERGDLRVRTHVLAHGDGNDGGGGAPPFRIAFVADIQQDDFTDGTQVRDVYATVNAARPDIVLSGGDWINTGPDHIQATAEAAGTLASRLGTFSVRGDHEHFAYLDRDRSVVEVERAMTAHGVAMLNNEVRSFDHAGKRIAIAFVNYNYIVRSTPEQIEAVVGLLAGADFKIVVTHQLDRALAPQLENRVDLILAAHTHGGQVNPVVGVVHANLARLETRFVDGRYALGTTTVIVTAGVGMSIVPIRYAAPASIELIDLHL